MRKLYSIKPISDPQKELKKSLGAGLNAYNKTKIGSSKRKEMGLEVRNPEGKLIGGLVGCTYWDWVHVFELWVAESSRGQGLGTALLAKAEAIGKKRGCRYIHLDTFNFQAPGFYKKQGFKRFGVLKPFPKGGARHYFYKKIGTSK